MIAGIFVETQHTNITGTDETWIRNDPYLFASRNSACTNEDFACHSTHHPFDRNASP